MHHLFSYRRSKKTAEPKAQTGSLKHPKYPNTPAIKPDLSSAPSSSTVQSYNNSPSQSQDLRYLNSSHAALHPSYTSPASAHPNTAHVSDTTPSLPRRWTTGFRRVHTVYDLQPHIDSNLVNRRVSADGTDLSPLRQLTTHLVETYHICNPQFRYEVTHAPRRVLTELSKPAHNDGYDNEDHDYILYVNDTLGMGEGHEYIILDIPGGEKYGRVVQCQNVKTGEIVAVKVIKNQPEYFDQGMMEATILGLLNKRFDPNDEHHILRLRDSFIHKNHLCLVFEHLSYNLYDLIKTNDFQGLSISLVTVFIAQLLDALTVLEEARLIHCDLKPENVLLKSLTSPQIKVVDFGSACYQDQAIYTHVQSRFYRSPEVLLGMAYTSAIDMWSLGCIAVELSLALPLFPGTSEYNQLTRIISLLGMPPLSMLNSGKQVDQFFDSYEVWNPHSNGHEKQYRLKNVEEYSRERGETEQAGSQYFEATTLAEIINTAPVRSSGTSGNEIGREMAKRAAFIDFCQGCLNLDPSVRWTPQQARMHPLITGEMFTKPLTANSPAETTQHHPTSSSTLTHKQPRSGSTPLQLKGPNVHYNTNKALSRQSMNNTGPVPASGQHDGGSLNQAHLSSGSGSGRAPASLSGYPNSRVQKNATNQTDGRPPALARLLPMHQDIINERRASNRDDATRERERIQQNRKSARAYLRQLSLTSAELHAVERFPPPRCHPGTRMELRGEIYDWLTNENREHNMMWLFGPAGVGKSAIAQTVGEFAEELGIFGAAIFFSRGRKIDSSSFFVTSIAHQLAGQRPSYENLVASIIRTEPAVLTSADKRAQLRKLLIEPFAISEPMNEPSTKQLIIIDGLDECTGEADQLELVELITAAVEDPSSPPFLWLICSRPEHHLKEHFLDGGLSNVCWGRDLLPQEVGADADVEGYLVDGLERIAEKYRDERCADPGLALAKGSETLNRLVRTVSGVFIIASSMLAFIGDPLIANPVSQLQIVIDAIDGSSADGGQNFLATIDALYMGVLGAVKKERLPQTLQILGACAVSPRMPALHLANFLGITHDVFYSSLRSLYAFLSVPHHTTAVQDSLHFFHASFPDFLLHRSRSGEYFQDSDDHRFKLLKACFLALDSTSTTYSDSLSWLPPDHNQDEDDGISSESPLSVSHEILSLATMHTWELCTRISKPQEWDPLLKTVANFDFGRLQPFSDALPVQPFIHFIRWVHALGKQVPDLTHVIRTDCNSHVDVLLLGKCVTISQPLNLESAEGVNELEESPRFVFAGLGAKTVVILLIPEAVMIYSIKDIDIL